MPAVWHPTIYHSKDPSRRKVISNNESTKMLVYKMHEIHGIYSFFFVFFVDKLILLKLKLVDANANGFCHARQAKIQAVANI
jgi:hypothetical protein